MKKETVYKSLLDCWSPPQSGQGNSVKANPISFISTTFTFDAEFFEEECLTRFLAMETEKENDGVAFLIEREEKLAGLNGGMVLVDQNNCKGERSLRWDLVPCRVKNGIMHAKITILHWSDCIRLIIGSANLTHPGYCLNQEIFTSIDYNLDCDTDLKIIQNTLDFLQDLTNAFCGNTTKLRYRKIQTEIKNSLRKWNVISREFKKDELGVDTLFISPSQRNGIARMREIWNSKFNPPPDSVLVTSPFFDTAETQQTPSKEILNILHKRSSVEVRYNVTTSGALVMDNKTLVIAPEYLKKSYSANHHINFQEFAEMGLNEDGKSVPRPLHQKSIRLAKDEMVLLMIGSSNFTSAALGLSKRINYEANLVFYTSRDRNKNGYQFIEQLNPPLKVLEEDKIVFQSRANKDEEPEESEYVNLPLCFEEAVVYKTQTGLQLHMKINVAASSVPQGFQINECSAGHANNPGKLLLNEMQWNAMGKTEIVVIDYEADAYKDYLLVCWEGSIKPAFWPVIVDSQIALPPVEQLRNLPLDALIYILSSNHPLHRILAIIEKAKKKQQQNQGDNAIIDAHKLVDTTGFLLQRTRRVSNAMRILRERLEKPVYTEESLNWRLYGPIGVISLRDAIVRESKTPEEKRFLLTELALEISRIQPQSSDLSLRASKIKDKIKEVLVKLSDEVNAEDGGENNDITKYSNNAFQKALNEF